MKAKAQALFAAVLASGMAMPAMAAGDAAAGKIKSDTCMGCHGGKGYANAYPTYRVPKIGGQSEAYIIQALKAYKTGERTHGTMTGQAVSLSEKDIADIAAYIASAPEAK